VITSQNLEYLSVEAQKNKKNEPQKKKKKKKRNKKTVQKTLLGKKS
jgi:hypothetical protein